MRDMTIERHQKPRPPAPPRSEEYIDISGHLRVPCVTANEDAPEREGWVPFWVNVNLNDETNGGIRKVVSYKQVEA